MSRLYHGNSLLEKKERRQLDTGISRANAEIDHIRINRKWCLGETFVVLFFYRGSDHPPQRA
ncbi:unnamed protein product [Nippostrongylus brasiliensis]|uniref:Transposase n=1 Tax=Nippostrongylus brasiliensis TaxID=27835 RepID=A0A0N4XMP9_NIPBR|nr:unnamed protein product [Nippostrongylus brasiliensis]